MTPQLTSGAIRRILLGEDVTKAVIQTMGYKRIPGSGTPRYRLIISDGETICPLAMLGTQLNHMIDNKELEKLTVIQVNKCACNQLQPDRKIIVFLDISVLVPGAQVGNKIGNPVSLKSLSNDTASASSTPAATKEPLSGPLVNATSKPNHNGVAEKKSYYSSGYSNVQNNYGNSSTDLMNTHPISSLTPYQNVWTIRARVTSKTPIKTWSNSRGEGKLFAFNLLDESGEIKVTGFNECADKFFDFIQVNKVYYISKAFLKVANKNYSTVKNDYEMSLGMDTTIIPCEDNTAAIPMLQFDFLPIPKIESVEKDCCVDVIGVCKSAGDPQTIVTRTSNRELVKREIQLVDTSNTEVNLTLWGDEATKFDGSANPVIAVKGARVSDYNGRSLSVLTSSVVQINPDIRDAHVLKGWFDREGSNLESQSISSRSGQGLSSLGTQWKTFVQVNAEKLGMGDKPDYYMAKASIVHIRKENCMYMACPSQECNKKVVDMNNGLYRCEKCNKEYPEFQWRLLLSISLADFTENAWVNCFQEAGEVLNTHLSPC